jgi:hypothetical protein
MISEKNETKTGAPGFQLFVFFWFSFAPDRALLQVQISRRSVFSCIPLVESVIYPRSRSPIIAIGSEWIRNSHFRKKGAVPRGRRRHLKPGSAWEIGSSVELFESGLRVGILVPFILFPIFARLIVSESYIWSYIWYLNSSYSSDHRSSDYNLPPHLPSENLRRRTFVSFPWTYSSKGTSMLFIFLKV